MAKKANIQPCRINISVVLRGYICFLAVEFFDFSFILQITQYKKWQRNKTELLRKNIKHTLFFLPLYWRNSFFFLKHAFEIWYQSSYEFFVIEKKKKRNFNSIKWFNQLFWDWKIYIYFKSIWIVFMFCFVLTFSCTQNQMRYFLRIFVIFHGAWTINLVVKRIWFILYLFKHIACNTHILLKKIGEKK